MMIHSGVFQDATLAEFSLDGFDSVDVRIQDLKISGAGSLIMRVKVEGDRAFHKGPVYLTKPDMQARSHFQFPEVDEDTVIMMSLKINRKTGEISWDATANGMPIVGKFQFLGRLPLAEFQLSAREFKGGKPLTISVNQITLCEA